MSDEERLHYAGATTGREGSGEKPKKLDEVPVDDFFDGDFEPGVGTASENRPPKEQ